MKYKGLSVNIEARTFLLAFRVFLSYDFYCQFDSLLFAHVGLTICFKFKNL